MGIIANILFVGAIFCWALLPIIILKRDVPRWVMGIIIIAVFLAVSFGPTVKLYFYAVSAVICVLTFVLRKRYYATQKKKGTALLEFLSIGGFLGCTYYLVRVFLEVKNAG